MSCRGTLCFLLTRLPIEIGSKGCGWKVNTNIKEPSRHPGLEGLKSYKQQLLTSPSNKSQGEGRAEYWSHTVVLTEIEVKGLTRNSPYSPLNPILILMLSFKLEQSTWKEHFPLSLCPISNWSHSSSPPHFLLTHPFVWAPNSTRNYWEPSHQACQRSRYLVNFRSSLSLFTSKSNSPVSFLPQKQNTCCGLLLLLVLIPRRTSRSLWNTLFPFFPSMDPLDSLIIYPIPRNTLHTEIPEATRIPEASPTRQHTEAIIPFPPKNQREHQKPRNKTPKKTRSYIRT